MGGPGSGRPWGFGRETVEGSRSLDCNKLHQAGCLREGYKGGWQWSVENEVVASIRIQYQLDCLELDYRARSNGGPWQDVSESVAIQRVPCRYGGCRPYFTCPGVVNRRACGRRVVKLYGTGRYFLCRHCWGLGYASQGEGILDRMMRRRDKLRRRLNESNQYEGVVVPPRPRGMWQRTYDRLSERIWEADAAANRAFELQAGLLLASLERRERRKKR
jgi:hypothetical protein